MKATLSSSSSYFGVVNMVNINSSSSSRSSSRRHNGNDTKNQLQNRRHQRGGTSRLIQILLCLSQLFLSGLCLQLLLLLLLLSTFPSILPFGRAGAAGSSRNYNVYNYDTTMPQFTPDGRLMQVEYASTATELSPPLVIVECTMSSSTDDSTPNNAYPCLILLTVKKQAMSPQHRIVILQQDGNNGDGERRIVNNKNNYRSITEGGYCVVMSGCLPDSVALLQVGLQRAAQHTAQYGSDSTMGMAAFTRVLADECQSCVMGRGLRPYGSTLVLCGYSNNAHNDDDDVGGSTSRRDDNNNYRRTGLGVIYQTDPSGGILQHNPPSLNDEGTSMVSRTSNLFMGTTKHSRDGDGRSDPPSSHSTVTSHVRCIVGGSPTLQRLLQKRIEQGLSKFERRRKKPSSSSVPTDGGTTLAERIATIAKILIKETDSKFDKADNSSGGGGSGGQHDTVWPSPSDRCPLEVVVISSRYGCHRLDEDQLRHIQQLIADIQ